MGDSGTDPFDFDAWAELARTDPSSFEAQRLEQIESLLAGLPEERREILRRYQWLIDRDRERAKTPLGACLRLSEMLTDLVHGDGGLRDRLQALSAVAQGNESPPEPLGSTILEFPTGKRAGTLEEGRATDGGEREGAPPDGPPDRPVDDRSDREDPELH